ncbi:MAG TPA: hypothetical protein VFJ69_09490 [Actinomycetota bacterium]|nr:hypothetical protein [Actinomycetota bacterium]
MTAAGLACPIGLHGGPIGALLVAVPAPRAWVEQAKGAPDGPKGDRRRRRR